MLFGQYRLSEFSDQDKEDFVRYGFARYARGTAVIDEPLGILAAVEWFAQDPKFSLFKRRRWGIGKTSPSLWILHGRMKGLSSRRLSAWRRIVTSRKFQP